MNMAHKEGKSYDIIIVGTGVASAICAKQLALCGQQILLIEAGDGDFEFFPNYQNAITDYYQSFLKGENSPFPANAFVPNGGAPDPSSFTGYVQQEGPQPFNPTYVRRFAGSTLHWYGHCFRLLPSDFNLQSLYGVGRDWPFQYNDLEPYYRLAEEELGVAADKEDQEIFGISFPNNYVYPMHRVPFSYLDNAFIQSLKGVVYSIENDPYSLEVTSPPQARNTQPNRSYNQGKGYRPTPAVSLASRGNRCSGNASCIPICPIQAKYTALRTLQEAQQTGHVNILKKSAVSKFNWNHEDGRIESVEVISYDNLSVLKRFQINAKSFILGTHGIESPRILLNSGIQNANNNIGENLYDQPRFLFYGLHKTSIGTGRGPLETSYIPGLRDGIFRKNMGAIAINLSNSLGSYQQFILKELIYNKKIKGKNLRALLPQILQRFFSIGGLVEQLPRSENRVTLSKKQDLLGIPLPQINYSLSTYEKKAIEVAYDILEKIRKKTGSKQILKGFPQGGLDFKSSQGTTVHAQNGGHIYGTCIMGDSPNTSVTSKEGRVWGHNNLYVAGSSLFPSGGSGNPTLTIAALAFLSSQKILKSLLKNHTLS